VLPDNFIAFAELAHAAATIVAMLVMALFIKPVSELRSGVHRIAERLSYIEGQLAAQQKVTDDPFGRADRVSGFPLGAGLADDDKDFH